MLVPVPAPNHNEYQPSTSRLVPTVKGPPTTAPATDAAGSSTKHPSITQISVLVADDSQIIRAMVCAHLQHRGFLVVPVADGVEALAALSVRKFDLLITDLEMPNMGGHALLEAVHDQYPLMRRVVMTGYTTIENALDALKLGAVGFIPKPIDLAALDEVVDLAVAEMRGWMRQLAAVRRLRRDTSA
jgi:DNA-binding NtrC family response regulator